MSDRCVVQMDSLQAENSNVKYVLKEYVKKVEEQQALVSLVDCMRSSITNELLVCLLYECTYMVYHAIFG